MARIIHSQAGFGSQKLDSAANTSSSLDILHWRNMSRQHSRDGKGRKWRGKPSYGKSSKEHTEKEAEVDLSSPIISTFFEFQKTLDKTHDKHERLVKLSRDITIESKRIIFLLQRVAGNQQQKESILEEADKKMIDLRQTKWRNVAEELQNEDPYQFIRAYSPGLQEYVECVSFYHFLQNQQIVSLNQIRNDLVFPPRPIETEDNKPEPITETADSKETSKTEQSTESGEPKDKPAAEVTAPEDKGIVDKVENNTSAASVDLPVYVSANDWLLGIADLTGELMRYAITRIGKGDTDSAHNVCNLMQAVHEAFVYFGNSHRDLPKKMNVLRQSIKKVESASYTLLVRGSEVPQEKLADVLMASSYSNFPELEDDYSGIE